MSSVTANHLTDCATRSSRDLLGREHRKPSKYYPEEKLMTHFLKRGRKLMNANELQEPRLSLFKELLLLSERYKQINQYV